MKIVKAVITVVLVLAVLTAIGFAFVPSVITSLDNGNEKRCHENSERLLKVLEDKLSGTEENKFWYDLVAEHDSGKLLSALNHELDKSVDISDYHVKFSGKKVMILCKTHPQSLDVSLNIPDNIIHTEKTYPTPATKLVIGIRAEGKSAYFQNEALDAKNPSKTAFNNNDDTNALFPDITVSAVYAGGGERVLDKDEYKILTGNLDMSVTGERVLKIIYNNDSWKNIFTTFTIDIVPNDKREPLVVDGGEQGVYELASWVWSDYVSDALDAPGNYMEFTASIVFENGQYYYFPDGFAILKDNKNNGSIAGAMDIDNHNKQAYYLIFDTASGVYTEGVAQSLAHDGSLKVADGKVYIWQNNPSKEFPHGWLQVFCEMKKLDE